MTGSLEETAREILAELEEVLATHDLEKMSDYFTEDVVMIGDDGDYLGRDAAVAYLKVMADMAATVRFHWEHVAVISETREELTFASVGTLEFYGDDGTLLAGPDPTRATCVAVRESPGWRLRHYHGSRPQL